MDKQEDTKPCLVQTRQGFSVLYNKRYLYSQYSPASSITKAISLLNIQPQTLVLAFSPVLPYGLTELIEKCPKDSLILSVFSDSKLFELALSQFPPSLIENSKFRFINCTSVNDFISKLYEYGADKGIFRRTIRIDMCSVSKDDPVFSSFQKTADTIIAQFWKNRITLTKLGRLYSRNLFQNLAFLPLQTPIKEKSISKPILVIGAGPSIEQVVRIINATSHKIFIIAVDNALPALLQNNITPDAVIAVESQLANEKPFIGLKAKNFFFYADLTSRPHLIRMFQSKVSLFFSKFTESRFLDRLSDLGILPVTIPPLGSVGLSAIQLALLLRYPNTPIFISGLDFSFFIGKTHCNGSSSSNLALSKNSRFLPPGNYNATFRAGTSIQKGLEDKDVVTDIALNGYGATERDAFSGINNLYEISSIKKESYLPYLNNEQFLQLLKNYAFPVVESGVDNHFDKERKALTKKILDYYNEELAALEELTNILQHGGENSRILELLRNREYLYLHFPDGYKEPTVDISFLKRVRAEINFFIKEIKRGKNTLSTIE